MVRKRRKKKSQKVNRGIPVQPLRDEPKIDGNKLSLFERNVVLLDGTADIFGFKKGMEWDDLRQNISGDQIRELYKLVAQLWPPETDIDNVLPKPSQQLRSLYLGDVDPSHIIQNVIRFSLYSDEILIFDPFHNPWFMAKDYNPVINPNQYKSDTLRLLFFLGLVEPWIKSGYVKLIPRPDLRDPSFHKLAEKRLSNWTPESSDLEDTEEFAKSGYFRFMATYLKSDLLKLLKTQCQMLPLMLLMVLWSIFKISEKTIH